jgi:hypothetical protein
LGITPNPSHDLAPVTAKFVVAMPEPAMLKAAFMSAKIAVAVKAVVLCDTLHIIVTGGRGRRSGGHDGRRGAKGNRQHADEFQGLFQIQHFDLLLCLLHHQQIGIVWLNA